jgi:hypothetical protein
MVGVDVVADAVVADEVAGAVLGELAGAGLANTLYDRHKNSGNRDDNFFMEASLQTWFDRVERTMTETIFARVKV